MTRAGRVGWALLRVGFAETLAYRFALLIWVLTSTIPLVNLALWLAVAEVAPVGRFTQGHFVAYFLGVLAVRQLTGSSVAPLMGYEISSGQLAVRLLRPIHPLFCYAAESLASLPLRAAPALGITFLGLWAMARGLPPLSLGRLALLLVATAGSFWINFFLAVTIGGITFFLENSAAISKAWQLAFLLLSGYVVPLELMPGPLRHAADVLPFYYMVAFPLDIWLLSMPTADLCQGFLFQALWLAASATLGLFVWRVGLRRFSAYGG